MPQNPAAALEDLVPTVDALIGSLAKRDGENAHTAVTVLLMQAFTSLGPDSVAMTQFFPVFDAIKTRIDASDLEGALEQARLFKAQLKEIVDIVRAGHPSRSGTTSETASSLEPN